MVARTPEKFRETGVDVRTETAVAGIDAGAARGRLSDGGTLPYDVLVMATGTKPVVPPLPGIDREGVFTLKTLEDAIRIKTFMKEKRCRSAVIAGGGFIGMEMCEAFRALGLETAVVDRGPFPVHRWDPELLKAIAQELQRNGVAFHGETGVNAIEAGRERRLRLETTRGALEADLILIALGVKPNVTLAGELGLQLGKSGAIEVNFAQQTSREGVYAVGDCAEAYHRVSRQWVHIPLGDIANKQGRVAGATIGGHPMVFPGIVGAQSFKVFTLEVAATGIGEREAAAAGFDPVGTVIWGNAMAGPMPPGLKVGLKLLADRATGLLLGAQAVGELGAVSRINTLSAALWAGMRLEDVAYLDLAYAPPFSGPWDPIHNAAQALLREMESRGRAHA
jgi:CoA-dependent NAD(P)H sulfur oxidoreductase